MRNIAVRVLGSDGEWGYLGMEQGGIFVFRNCQEADDVVQYLMKRGVVCPDQRPQTERLNFSAFGPPPPDERLN